LFDALEGVWGCHFGIENREKINLSQLAKNRPSQNAQLGSIRCRLGRKNGAKIELKIDPNLEYFLEP